MWRRPGRLRRAEREKQTTTERGGGGRSHHVSELVGVSVGDDGLSVAASR